MKRIEVDFNNRGPGGTVIGSLRSAGDVAIGETVVIFDPGEDMEFLSTVVAAYDGRVFYEPEWVRARKSCGVEGGQ